MAQIVHSPVELRGTGDDNDEPFEPPTPTDGQWVNDNHSLLRTSSPDMLSPTSPSDHGGSKWKGKGRAVDEPAVLGATEVDITGGGRVQNEEQDDRRERERGTLVPSLKSYPPASEEAIAEQRVNATLQRWEQLERQRRKSHRESQASIDSTHSSSHSSSPTSGPGNVTRRGTLFWSGKTRKPAPGSHPLATGERSASDEVFVPPSESIPESEDVGVVRSTSGRHQHRQQSSSVSTNMNDAREAFLARHKKATRSGSGSTDSHVSDSSVATVTPGGPNRASTVSTAVGGTGDGTSNPFADPASLKGKGKQVVRSASTGSNPFSDTKSPPRRVDEDEDENEDEDEFPRTLHPPTAGSQGIARPERYPTPKPLGLPLTSLYRGGTTMSTANLPITSETRQRRQGGQGGQGNGDEDEEDEPAEEGRWWTDWLCGCREGPGRGGDHQAGRTNPME